MVSCVSYVAIPVSHLYNLTFNLFSSKQNLDCTKRLVKVKGNGSAIELESHNLKTIFGKKCTMERKETVYLLCTVLSVNVLFLQRKVFRTVPLSAIANQNVSAASFPLLLWKTIGKRMHLCVRSGWAQTPRVVDTSARNCFVIT